jgi:Uma2 family endonuclease
MTQAKVRFANFEEYLSYNDGTDILYELFNGELIEVPPESGRNSEIINLLFTYFLPLVGYRKIRTRGLEVEVRGEPRNRYPDLTILREEHISLLQQRDTIRLFMPPPLLVVEVVSPGDVQRDRDYIAKRMQYQDREIPEYWIVDPELQQVVVLTLLDKTYEEQVFQGNHPIMSKIFPALLLTVNQVFLNH